LNVATVRKLEMIFTTRKVTASSEFHANWGKDALLSALCGSLTPSNWVG